MGKVWLLVDCNCMCHRAAHTTGGLSFHGVATGVTFGLLRDLEGFIELFEADRCVLAFDGRNSLREKEYPHYKITRRTRELTEDERLIRSALYEEMGRLQREILPAAGFNNVICCEGYEADDVIAKVVDDLPSGTEAVIVSTDKDLFQCLSRDVMQFNPITKKATTSSSFRRDWGILPFEWASVKAWAGCSTDDIEGLDGIGEKTAVKWVTGTLKPKTEAYQKFDTGTAVYNRNIRLVRLPFPGIVVPPIVADDATQARLAHVRAGLGIRSDRASERNQRKQGRLF